MLKMAVQSCPESIEGKAAASEEARRTLRYVEPLSDARTKLADFFSILLNVIPLCQKRAKEGCQKKIHMREMRKQRSHVYGTHHNPQSGSCVVE